MPPGMSSSTGGKWEGIVGVIGKTQDMNQGIFHHQQQYSSCCIFGYCDDITKKFRPHVAFLMHKIRKTENESALIVLNIGFTSQAPWGVIWLLVLMTFPVKLDTGLSSSLLS